MRVWWMLLVLVRVQGYGIKLGEGCLDEERQGLLKLKAAFNDPKGSSLPSWDAREEADCCRWEKVTCEPVSRRVTQLHLHMTRDRHLGRQSWTLNASLFLPFQDLQVLVLSSNILEGLTEFPILPKLQVLDVSSNCLNRLPSVGVLQSLKTLDVESNHLNSTAEFGELTSLKKLEVLNVGYNSLTGSIPITVSELPSLKALSFRRNQLNGSLPIEGVSSSPSLYYRVQTLWLNGFRHSGSMPLFYACLRKCQIIWCQTKLLYGVIFVKSKYRYCEASVQEPLRH